MVRNQYRKVIRYINLAKEYVLKYRKFIDVEYAKQYFLNVLDNNNWNPYIKSMFCFLTNDEENGKKYYKLFLEDPFFKRIIDEYNYPKTIDGINKDYVIKMIAEQRKYWHSKSFMKKMKNYDKYE